ncbi:MAG: HK97 family phage prohead protease [Xanthomonadales bacterium]|nr:HK97 family phage prohead protease [Xanthomonadales bacterium]
MTEKIEKRAASQPVAVEGMTVAGYAAVFNSPTDIGDMWQEVVAPGAFAETLRSGSDVLALYSHEIERLLGRQSSGTLRLSEDERGLSVEIDLPDTSDGRDVATLIKRGDLKGMSFGFCVTHDEWDETTTPPKRTIHAVDLREVTITASPAYEDTECGMRSLEKVKAEREKREKEAEKKADNYFKRKAETDQRVRGIR